MGGPTSGFSKGLGKNSGPMTMPGGESLQEVQERAVVTLEWICRPFAPGNTLLICSHNFVIIALLCHASKTALDRFRDWRQDTAALNIIYKDGDQFQVERVNEQRNLNGQCYGED